MSTLKIAIDRLKLNGTGQETPAAIFSQVAMLAIILDLSARQKDVTRPLLREITGLSNFGVLSIVNGLIRANVIVETMEDGPTGGHARLVYSLAAPLRDAGAISNAKLHGRKADLRHDRTMLVVIARLLERLYGGRRPKESMTLVLKQLATAVHLLYLCELGEEMGRKALADLTDLTPAALSLHLAALSEKGLFQVSSAQPRAGGGRPELRYAIAQELL